MPRRSQRQPKRTPETRRKGASAASPIPIDRRREPAVVKHKTEIVHAMFSGQKQSERAVMALTSIGFHEQEISACPISEDAPRREDPHKRQFAHSTRDGNVVDAAAAIIGGAVAVGVLAVVAPLAFLMSGVPGNRQQQTEPAILVAVQTKDASTASRAAEALLRSGGQRVALFGQYVFSGEESAAGQSLDSSLPDS